jgi:uncharacterized membrane protein YfcA
MQGLLSLLSDISWGAVACVLCMIGAFTGYLLDEEVLAVVFGLCSISWALLSLADTNTTT